MWCNIGAAKEMWSPKPESLMQSCMYEENWAWKPSLRNNFQFIIYLQPCSKRAPHYQDPPSPSGAFELSPKKINVRCFSSVFTWLCTLLIWAFGSDTMFTSRVWNVEWERRTSTRERLMNEFITGKNSYLSYWIIFGRCMLKQIVKMTYLTTKRLCIFPQTCRSSVKGTCELYKRVALQFR